MNPAENPNRDAENQDLQQEAASHNREAPRRQPQPRYIRAHHEEYYMNVNMSILCIDQTWSPPTIVYQPVPNGQCYLVQIYRVLTTPPNYGGQNKVAFCSYHGGNTIYYFNQNLYIPFVSPVTGYSPTPGVSVVQSAVLTKGVSQINSSQLDTNPLYYNNYTVYPNKTGMPSFGFRISSLAAGNTAQGGGSYVSGSGVVPYLNPNGQETIFTLYNGQNDQAIAYYVWRKIDSCYSDSNCPAGYASGPEDLFLQQSHT